MSPLPANWPLDYVALSYCTLSNVVHCGDQAAERLWGAHKAHHFASQDNMNFID